MIQARPSIKGRKKLSNSSTSSSTGCLDCDTPDNFFGLGNSYVHNTIAALKQQFQDFSINNNFDSAILFGRYPGDTYDGYRNDGRGNPWTL